MNKNKRLLRPGSRLSLLESMLVEPYQTVWDCCCDHGLLGMSLLKRSRAGEVVFVDVLEEQMKKPKERSDETTYVHRDHIQGNIEFHPIYSWLL